MWLGKFGLVCLVWYVWFGRFGLVGLEGLVAELRFVATVTTGGRVKFVPAV